MKNDYSKEIFEKYFNKDQPVEITLTDGSIIEGFLVSFSHGDENSNEPYIVRWHFVGKNQIDQYRRLFSVAGEETGKSIEQNDIKSIKFK